MNNQRRHELERNVLADKLGEGIEKVHPLIKPVGIAIVAGIVGLFGYQIYNGQNSKKASKEWTEYYFNRTSGDAQSFEALGQAFSNSVTGQWSKHSAARGFLSDGIDALYTNRKEAVENIRKAITEWESVKDSSITELRAAANRGLAQAHESLGELDEAVVYLEAFAEMPSTSQDEREAANNQISYLKSSGTKSFYEWFNKLDPKPTAPPTISNDLSQPPTSPTISLDPSKLPEFDATPLVVPNGNELTPIVPESPVVEPATPVPPAQEPASPTSAAPESPAPADVPITPAATEPAATEPAATEPAATEPAATEPAATEPTEPAAEPVVESPEPGPAPTEIPK